MAIADPPTVKVNGEVISSGWDTADLLVLAGLSITWGRRSHYDEAKAAQLKIEFIDPDGHRQSADDLQGRLIEVIRADGRTIFRGRLDDYAVEPEYITDPDSFRRRRVWRLKMSAACKLAELGQAVLPGSGNNSVRVSELGPSYWETKAPADRLTELMSQGANQIVSSIQWTNPYGSGGWYPLARFRKFADGWSALDFITSLYNAIPFAHVNYNPHNNGVEPGVPAETDGLDLTWDGATLDVVIPDGLTIPGDTVGVPSGYDAATGLDESVDVIQVVTPQLSPDTGYEIVNTAVERQTARFNPTLSGRRVQQFQNDIYYNPGTGPDAWQHQLLVDLKPMVDQINGKLKLPTLRLDWRRFDYPDAATQALLDTYDKPLPIYFPGSIFNIIVDAGAAHQVIGGTLTYARGWTHDVTVAPAIGTGAGLTIDQLVTIDPPTMGDYDDDITLADLGNVTTGVTA